MDRPEWVAAASVRARRRLRHVHQQHQPHRDRRSRTRGRTTPSATSCAGRAPVATTAPTRSCGRCSPSPAAGSGTGDGSTVSPGDAFGSPDGLAFDPDGRLWIETDGSQPVAVQQPDARRRPDDRRHPPLPRRTEGLRDHRLDDDRRPAHDVRQRPAPGRGCHRSGQPGRHSRTGPTTRVARARRRSPSAATTAARSGPDSAGDLPIIVSHAVR